LTRVSHVNARLDRFSLDEDRYIVSFFGNGNTPEHQVWNYWIYRCAELTIEKGYELFSMTPSDEHALLQDPDRDQLVRFEMLDNTGEENGRYAPVQYYYYTVTTYSSKGLVEMYKAPIPEGVDVEVLLDAQTIIDLLRPYVESGAKVNPPDRGNLFIRASVEAAIKAKLLDEEQAEKLRGLQI